MVPADELRLLHNALRLDAAACAKALKSRPERNQFGELLELSAAGNIAGVMRAVLGPRFREPDAGAAAVFARVHRGYTGADWGPALSAARQLETMGIPDSPLHQMARVYAAGIHLHRGEHHLASEWLATVTRAPRFACARAVVECNLLHFSGQHRQALDLVLRTAHEARRRGLRPVQDRLQLMGVQIALRVGDQAAAHEFLRELRKLHRAEYTLCTTQVVLLGRALIHRDSTAAAMAVDVVRRRGHKPDLLWAAQILAQFCDDPRPVMDELHTFAREGDPAFLLHDRVATLLQRFDIRTPSNSGARPFSPTQQRIIDLVTAGHTNRQIATELSISEKRVQSHLTQLFAQTGCRSRVQLAAASINNQLAPHV